MQYTNILALLTAVAGTAMAAPAPQPAADLTARQSGSWTMHNFQRQCGGGNCHFSFGINTNDGSAATACEYDIKGNPATQAPYQGIQCGAFTIGSTWDGTTFPGNGFQTLSVVKGCQIIFPVCSL